MEIVLPCSAFMAFIAKDALLTVWRLHICAVVFQDIYSQYLQEVHMCIIASCVMSEMDIKQTTDSFMPHHSVDFHISRCNHETM